MTASIRYRSAAALAGCLLALTAPAALAQSATPAPAAQPALAAQPASPPVTVTVTSSSTAPPRYRIAVRNGSRTTLDTIVRQELPGGTTAAAISRGGQATGGPGGAEIAWRLTLAAGGAVELTTTLAPPPSGVDLSAPACVFPGNRETPYDCATATWNATGAARAAQSSANAAPELTPATPPAWWARPPVQLTGVAALALLAFAAAGWGWRRRRRRTAARIAARTGSAGAAGGPRAAEEPKPPTGPAGEAEPLAEADPMPARSTGTLYAAHTAEPDHPVRPATPIVPAGPVPLNEPASPSSPRWGIRRRKPPAWLAIGLAALLAAGLAGTVLWTGSSRVDAISAQHQPSSGAWVGRTMAGPLGTALRDAAFEFTVYRLICPPTAGRCQVVAGVHNHTERSQLWYGAMQRAYLPSGNWVSLDEAATRTANGGRDLFAEPVPADGRLLVPLVFATPVGAAPDRIELRSAVFSAGVSVDVP